ncbi:unnamed protein product [Paramecium octaurelia]|uniref:Transmembrane protein n=1 Tax=Paramecium octaurelia TaxID=43137 RepID=A0A8S1RSD8_PAROT|nr:unnamed protein product [Paramecium octaurelia]
MLEFNHISESHQMIEFNVCLNIQVMNNQSPQPTIFSRMIFQYFTLIPTFLIFLINNTKEKGGLSSFLAPQPTMIQILLLIIYMQTNRLRTKEFGTIQNLKFNKWLLSNSIRINYQI